MTTIGINSGKDESEFYAVLESGNGTARPGREGYLRALGDARADGDQAQIVDAALEEKLWDEILAAFGFVMEQASHSPANERRIKLIAALPEGYAIQVSPDDGKPIVFHGRDELAEVESLEAGIALASHHASPASPGF